MFLLTVRGSDFSCFFIQSFCHLNVEQQFPQQRKCFDFYWLTFITLSFLATFIIDTGPDVKNKEYTSYLRNKYKQMGFTKVTLEDILFPDISRSMYSILIASAFFMVIACSGYTTCIKPWIYYRKKLATLEDIQRNKITVKNRDKMFNTMTVISPETEEMKLEETKEMQLEAGQLRRRITSIRP